MINRNTLRPGLFMTVRGKIGLDRQLILYKIKKIQNNIVYSYQIGIDNPRELKNSVDEIVNNKDLFLWEKFGVYQYLKIETEEDLEINELARFCDKNPISAASSLHYKEKEIACLKNEITGFKTEIQHLRSLVDKLRKNIV